MSNKDKCTSEDFVVNGFVESSAILENPSCAWLHLYLFALQPRQAFSDLNIAWTEKRKRKENNRSVKMPSLLFLNKRMHDTILRSHNFINVNLFGKWRTIANIASTLIVLEVMCVKSTSIAPICLILLLNPMFDHLLESSWWYDSNKWSNIGFGKTILTSGQT